MHNTENIYSSTTEYLTRSKGKVVINNLPQAQGIMGNINIQAVHFRYSKHNEKLYKYIPTVEGVFLPITINTDINYTRVALWQGIIYYSLCIHRGYIYYTTAM